MGREEGGLSVAIVSKNEEERLPGCLDSVGFADEVVVVDSESSDHTVDVARNFGARVLIEKWRGYSGQKQYAVDCCRNPWVLILDADERIPLETAEIIMKALAGADPSISAFSFRRKNLLHGRWVKRCGWWPDRVLRLVDRRRGRFDGRPVHEQWVTDGKIDRLNGCIEHISFRNYSELVDKMERYSCLASEELFLRNVKASGFTPVSHGLWMFFRTYVLELGLLEGFDGLVISLMNAGGSFLKYAKLREKWIYSGKGQGSGIRYK
ncbi:MAG: LPS biosynthesis protein [Deltaproteobacteria bacterium HGW-Deltaproteobacteria-21]|nr:MAG: LPS biosynthesis protein [Deltaproteobacteria bacterium HGW-Deltaproteobacteria-21]